MVSKALKEKLEKQQYGFTGQHSAVKICTWTKKSLRDEGVCYKEQFYGIKSHRCCQISPSVGFCQNNCIFCWRELDLEEGRGTVEVSNTIPKIDNPDQIIENSILQQRKLLTGFGGNEKVNLEKFKESNNPTQWAISLTGEPTLYPKINELIKKLKDKGNSVFVVSNGLQPEIMENIEMPTQLYISLDAPTEEIFNKVDRSVAKNAWNKLLETLDILKKLKTKGRTSIRITVIKGMNDIHPEKYAELLDRSGAMFVEVKGYMFVGSSRQRLSIENMPRFHEVKAFAEKICKHNDYEIIDEKEKSYVVLLSKPEDKDKKIINLPEPKNC